jgi:hypothetical protein
MDWIGHVLRLNFACADSKHQQLSNFVWQSSEKLKDGTHSLNRAFVAAYILAGIQDSQYCAFTKTLGCGHLSRPIINNYSQQLFNIVEAIFQKQINHTTIQINKKKIKMHLFSWMFDTPDLNVLPSPLRSLYCHCFG